MDVPHTPMGVSQMAALASVSDCRLLAKNPLKLPGRFRCRVSALLMTEDGWEAEWRVSSRGGAGWHVWAPPRTGCPCPATV